MMRLHPNKPIMSLKISQVKNALNIPNLLNIIVQPQMCSEHW